MRRDATGRITSTIVAAVSVVVMAVALVGFLVDRSGDDESPAAAEQQTSTESPAADNIESAPTDSEVEAGSEGEAADAKSSPKPTAKPKPKPKDKKKPKDKQKKESEPQPEPAVPSVYVEVYNMTSVSGLASSKAAQLQDAGWQVVGIDNWRGNIPSSTVYYPDGMADEATQLANSLGISRTRGAVAPMKFDRLTVILTSDAV